MLKMLRRLGQGLLILIILAGVYFLTPHGRFTLAIVLQDFNRDPLTRLIEAELSDQRADWGRQVELPLEIFGENLSRQSVEMKLETSGFSKVGSVLSFDIAWMQSEFDVGSDLYHANVSGLPCATGLYVFLWFDQNDLLTKAKTAQFEAGCL